MLVSLQERRPSVIAVVGAQWGDEGKGRVVDLLAKDADVVIRAHGGDNAGHTVCNHRGKFALHLIPAGIFNPDAINIIGAGVALNLKTLLQETKALSERGVETDRLIISPKAHLAFDYHCYIDGRQEELRGANKIGTTKRGIGPTYMDKAERIGLRASLLKEPENLLKALSGVLTSKRQTMFLADCPDEFNPEYYRDLICEASRVFGSWVVDSQEIVNKHLQNGSRFVIEGAHGTLLDLDHGTYPNVTSSNTTVLGLLNGAEIPPGYLTQTIGVFKAYQTRVGNGGMPTELTDKQGDFIREKGCEFGTTTGRPRRVGFFDGVAACYAHEINGFSDIVITKLDVLSGSGDLRICQGYRDENGQRQDRFVPADRLLARCSPDYSQQDLFPGWTEDISGVRTFDGLPEAAQRYCLTVHGLVPNTNLWMIGVGPDREANIFPAISL